MNTVKNRITGHIYSSPQMEALEITVENGVCTSSGNGVTDPLTESNDWGNIFNGE